MSRNTWNFSYQKQEQQVVEKEEEENRYPRSHVHNQQNQNLVDPMSNKCEVAELTWENGQLAMHRLGINLSNEQTKQIWGKTGDTLESIVHQATFQKQNHSNIIGSSDGQNQANINMDKNASYGCQQTRGVLKRMRSSDSDPQLYVGGRSLELMSARASANDNNITMVTWPCNEDSACHGGSENKEEERETKSSNLSKRSRRAAVHNQSERRRRDRINEKMKALQKLVPNASKTDKASMLEEVIKYLKQLQAQIELISNARNMEQQMMMMSLGMQSPHIQMALLARMGMCSTTTTAGMLTANLARAAPYLSPLIYPTSSLCPPFMSPAFAMPSSIPTPSQPNGDAMISPTITKSAASPNIATTTSFPFNNHPYNAFLPQSMKMEFNNEMAAQYLQQGNQENVNIQGKKE